MKNRILLKNYNLNSIYYQEKNQEKEKIITRSKKLQVKNSLNLWDVSILKLETSYYD